MPRKGILLLLSLLAISCLLAGAVGTYFYYSIPNDVKAEKLLRQARSEMREGNKGQAQASLRSIVRQYPRTDAAAFASFGLFEMLAEENGRLSRELTALKSQQQRQLRDLEARLKSRPAPTPVPPVFKAPEAVKKAPAARARRVRPAPRRRTTPRKKAPVQRRRAENDIPLQFRLTNSVHGSLS